MARTPAFDHTSAVRAALDVFWRVGYDAASIPELERATGLSRSSMYNSFGSKRGLFDAAVQFYLDRVVRPRLQPLTADPTTPDAIDTYLTGLRDALARPDALPALGGCLLINTAGSALADDPVVAATIAAYRAELFAAIRRGVSARLPAHDPATIDRLAHACTGQVVAAFALVRVSAAEAAQALTTARELIAACEEATSAHQIGHDGNLSLCAPVRRGPVP
ncbi:TetR family transcriptional regulator [Leucobacter chromiireducens]|uniref:TetR family transcriptional regulator n=1 Tax=Leucobacter chromiireducens TaxID=283877 RepID=UPI0019259D5B